MAISEQELKALREEFIRENGYWRPLQEGLARFDVEWMKIFARFTTGSKISPKMQHLIWIAVDASTTHLYETGIRHHAILAQKHGATRDQVFETLQLAAEVAGLSAKASLPVLIDELQARGRQDELPLSDALTDEQREMKRNFVAAVGCWPTWLDTACRAMPGFARLYCEVASRPHATGTLTRKERALISVAVYAAPTTVHEPSIREFIRLALDEGATGAEVAEVVHLASGIALHTMSVGAPAVLKALDGIDIPPQ